jgi:hypothetical protein
VGNAIDGVTADNCYCVGAVSGATTNKGMLGVDEYGMSVFTSCYWDTETSGQATSAGGTGKTTANMKKEATFVDWDFVDTWDIVEDTSYPTLQ